jgi:hypothetical protein
VQQFSDLASADLEMQMIAFQQKSVLMATYNQIRAELEMSEHILKTEEW